MLENLNIGLLSNLIELGTVGFLAGVVLPAPFYMAGSVIDAVKAIIGRS